MNGADQMLRHIEDGDPVVLSEQNWTDSLIHLLKHRLLVLKDNHLYLTDKGKAVKENILRTVRERQEQEMAAFSDESCRRSRILFLISVVVFLLALVLFAIHVFTHQQEYLEFFNVANLF